MPNPKPRRAAPARGKAETLEHARDFLRQFYENNKG